MVSDPREVWGDLATAAFVGASVLFKSLDESERADLLKLARLQTFAPGEQVVRQGERGDDFFLVRSGEAVVSAERVGRVVELGSLERGACFGEFVVLGEPARVATVAARTELTVVRFPGSMIAALARRHPRLLKLLEALRDARRKGGDEKAG